MTTLALILIVACFVVYPWAKRDYDSIYKLPEVWMILFFADAILNGK